MFFGRPLTVSRTYDSIFRNSKNADTLHHLYVSYHQHFFGDTNACLVLQDLFEKKYTKDVTQIKRIDDGLLQKKEVKPFLKKVGGVFEQGILSLTTEFKNHSLPIVLTENLDAFIDEAVNVFGTTWDHLLALCSVVKTREGSVVNSPLYKGVPAIPCHCPRQ